MSPSISNFLLPSGLGLIITGLRLLWKDILVGLRLALEINVIVLIVACIDGEKHCFPTLVGEGEPTSIQGEVTMCSDSEQDRRRQCAIFDNTGSLVLSENSVKEVEICRADCTSLSFWISRAVI